MIENQGSWDSWHLCCWLLRVWFNLAKISKIKCSKTKMVFWQYFWLLVKAMVTESTKIFMCLVWFSCVNLSLMEVMFKNLPHSMESSRKDFSLQGRSMTRWKQNHKETKFECMNLSKDLSNGLKILLFANKHTRFTVMSQRQWLNSTLVMMIQRLLVDWRSLLSYLIITILQKVSLSLTLELLRDIFWAICKILMSR